MPCCSHGNGDTQITSSAGRCAAVRIKVREAVKTAARRFADLGSRFALCLSWKPAYPKAVASPRNDLDDLLTCFHYKTLTGPCTAAPSLARAYCAVRRRGTIAPVALTKGT